MKTATQKPDHILLTGATGVLGKRILLEILQHNQMKVTCLIRSNSKKSFKTRSNELYIELKDKLPDISIELLLNFIEGDITKKQWGISSYDSPLILTINRIIHSAADVSLTLSDDEANLNIINACNEMLEIQNFILQNGQECKIDYVSTVGVIGKSHHPLREEICLESRTYHNNYEAYKARAENIICEIKDHHPERLITIHRPSMIIGDSATGEISTFQIFYFILAMFLDVGKKRTLFIPQILDYKIDTIPVNIVARSIFLSSLHKNPVFILNHCTGKEHSWSIEKIIQCAEKSGIPIRKKILLPVVFFKFSLSFIRLIFIKNKKINRIVNLYSSILDYTRIPPSFTNHKTLNYYKEFGIILPNPEDYMKNVLSYFVSHKKT
jgi:thioester reductase-like protein